MPWHQCIFTAVVLVFLAGNFAEASVFVPFPRNYSSVLRQQLSRKRNRTLNSRKIGLNHLKGESDFHVVNNDDIKDNATPYHDVSLGEGDRGNIPPLVPKEEDESAREAARQKRELVHNKWNTSSFLGGIAVGVVSTLLLLGCFLDRRANKVQGLEKEQDSILDKWVHWFLGERLCGGGPPETSQTQGNFDPETVSAGQEDQRNIRRATEPVIQMQRNLGDDPVEESLHLYWPRLGCLVLMLLIQSISSIILAGFQDLVVDQPSLIFFLTMIVGLGGNAGGQSAVLTVRRLALGQKSSILEQFNKGILLSLVMAPLAFVRAIIQGTNFGVCLTISIAVFFITILATTAGTALPRIFATVRIDPAHATPVIQVLMDISGIMIVCAWGVIIL